MGGFEDGVLDALNRAGVEAPLLKVALVEGFVHHGAVDDLRRQRIDAGESTLRFARRWACRSADRLAGARRWSGLSRCGTRRGSRGAGSSAGRRPAAG